MTERNPNALGIFRWSLMATGIGLLVAFLFGGLAGLGVVIILSILEISLSFDNAVVNAKVLDRMSPRWQKLFLTVGILIAVFGMRVVLPLAIVSLTAWMSPLDTLHLALYNGTEYGHKLHEAHDLISAFGGIFLLTIFLDFIFEQRSQHWLPWLEKPLGKIGRLDTISPAIVGAIVMMLLLGTEVSRDTLGAALGGMVLYLVINALSQAFAEAGEQEDEDEKTTSGVKQATGRAAFFLFVYLEVLDASFSFDGVIGAFAISTNLFEIALGLGIGAMYIRSLTVFLVRKGTLKEFVYLEHGAHWAIGGLAVCMLISIGWPVPEWFTGSMGAVLILAALVSSFLHKSDDEQGEPSATPKLETADI